MFDRPAEEDVVLRTAEYPRYFQRSYAFHFTHFKGGWRREPTQIMKWEAVLPDSTTTDIQTVDGGWIWFIDIVSVGTVLDARYAKTMGETPQERFAKGVASCVQVSEWLQGGAPGPVYHAPLRRV